MTTTNHPCISGPDGQPCGRAERCRLCWLYAHDERYRLLWSGAAAAPTLLRKALNFGKALTRHVAAGCPQAPEAEHARRLSICRSGRCGHYDAATESCRHRDCGCQLTKKASWELERCPLGLWERERAEAIRFDEFNLFPKQLGGKRFNASLIEWQDGYALAFRDGWKGSNVHVATLTKEFRPLQCVRLKLLHPAANYGREDPRLFWFQNQLHVAYVGVVGGNGPLHTNVLYARLGRAFRVEQIYFPRYAGRAAWEKNWQFFEHDGRLHAVYSATPQRVLRIDGERAELAYTTQAAVSWRGGEIRGGASPVRVGGEFWSFFHDRIEVRGHRVYRVGLYTFAAAPPFRLTRMISAPLLTADRSTKPADQYCSCVFPCGAVRLADGDWLVSMGVHDRWTEIRRFDGAALAAALQPVGEP